MKNVRPDHLLNVAGHDYVTLLVALSVRSLAQGFGTEVEEVYIRIDFFFKKSASIVNPTPILPALFTPNKRSKERGQNWSGIYDWHGLEKKFDSEGNFFFYYFSTKTLCFVGLRFQLFIFHDKLMN